MSDVFIWELIKIRYIFLINEILAARIYSKYEDGIKPSMSAFTIQISTFSEPTGVRSTSIDAKQKTAILGEALSSMMPKRNQSQILI